MTPRLKAEDVCLIIPECQVIGKAMRGGQKIVFPCKIREEKYAVKFILLQELADKEEDDGDTTDSSDIEEIRSRAQRELSIMKKVSSYNLIKMGAIDLTHIEYKDQDLLYYSEEWIEGKDLGTVLKEEVYLTADKVVKLGIDIAQAITQIWEQTKNVHRDIKPQNIIQRASDGSYVLLDLGMAFDLEDKSLTKMGYVPGTKIYFSPEQLDWKRKRDIDFRSDLFSLGIVMYQAITGVHPFYKQGMDDNDLFNHILNVNPIPPVLIRPDIPQEINDVIMRLLSKMPNARYRKAMFLVNKLRELLDNLEG